MDCIRCGYSFKYVDRRYPVLVRKEGIERLRYLISVEIAMRRMGTSFIIRFNK